jgi:ribosomal-protein-alanine N-acetyltransferase
VGAESVANRADVCHVGAAAGFQISKYSAVNRGIIMFPKLETSRLLLTELEHTDACSVFELFSNEHVVEFYDMAAFTTVLEAEQLIQRMRDRYDSKAGIRWGIRLKSSNEFIGTCGFNSWNSAMRNAVIGYELSESLWGQGLATEALIEIICAGFGGKLSCGTLHRIQADTVVGNIRSERLLTKIGFQAEGLRRECGFWKGAYHDLKCFGLLRDEFEARLNRSERS